MKQVSALVRLVVGLSLVQGLACAGDFSLEGDGSPTPAGVVPDANVRHLLFVGTESTGRSHLFVMGAEGEALFNLTGQSELLSDEQVLVPTSEAYPYPVPSEDGSRVLVAVETLSTDERSTTRELYEISTSDGTAHSLGTVPTGLKRAFYERSGERVLFEARDESTGLAQLYLLTGAGAEALGPPSEELSFDAFFPPPGNRLLVRRGHNGERQLAVLDLDDRSLTPLTDPLDVEILAPRVSPDGRRILFQGWTDASACSDLFVVEVDEGQQAPRPLGFARAVWELLEEKGEDSDVWEASVDASWGQGEGDDTPAPTPAAAHCLPVGSPTWALGDSGRIAFLATTDRDNNRTDVFTARWDGVDLQLLSGQLETEGGTGVTSSPRWSPDGDRLLFSFSATDAEAATVHLYLVDPDGGQAPDRLTDGYAGVPSMAHWSRDGEAILFWGSAPDRSAATTGTAGEAVVIALDGGQLEPMTADLALTPSYPLWLGENTLLYWP